jgi:2-iminobutanoate/2-iminopropanoate deaminase
MKVIVPISISIFLFLPLTTMAQQNAKIKTIGSDVLARPAAPFSQAVISGHFIFVSGQAGVDFTTGKIEPDFEKQARQAFDNLKKVLEASGSDLAHTIKIVVWLKKAEDFDQLNALFKEYFPTNPPARSVPVVDLPKPEYLLSIEATAVLK